MPLFKTKTQIQEYIRVSFTTSETSLPKQVAAEEEYIIPIIGQTLFEDLQTEADTNPTVSSATPLLKKVWAALAYMAYYKELPYLYTQITESGVKNITNDKVQSAYLSQYKDLKLNIENDGLAALERLLQYMIDNYSNNTDWTGSDAYKRLNKNLLRTGAEFSRYYSLHHVNRTYYSLQPIVQEVEDFFIIPNIGDAYFAELRDKATPTTDEKEVIDLLKKAAANLTIHKALTKKALTITPNGVTVTLSAGADTVNQGDGNAPQADKMALSHSSFYDGSSYLTKAIEVLNTKASGSVFATWFASDKYVDPTIVVESPNAGYAGVFT